MRDMPIVSPIPLNPLADGRQSERAMVVRRGVQRLLSAMGAHVLPEISLASGRRADLVALTSRGDIWIIEIKSSLEDFRADQKWPEYWDYADCVLFAVAPDFPTAILPAQTGLILADRYGGEIIRMPERQPLAPARRRSMQLSFARAAALRLAYALDPGVALQNKLD